MTRIQLPRFEPQEPVTIWINPNNFLLSPHELPGQHGDRSPLHNAMEAQLKEDYFGYDGDIHDFDRISCAELKNLFDLTYITLPVYAYVHSDVLVGVKPFTCPWDSGRIGMAWMSKPDLARKLGIDTVLPEHEPEGHATIEKTIAQFNTWLQEAERGITA